MARPDRRRAAGSAAPKRVRPITLSATASSSSHEAGVPQVLPEPQRNAQANQDTHPPCGVQPRQGRPEPSKHPPALRHGARWLCPVAASLGPLPRRCRGIRRQMIPRFSGASASLGRWSRSHTSRIRTNQATKPPPDDHASPTGYEKADWGHDSWEKCNERREHAPRHVGPEKGCEHPGSRTSPLRGAGRHRGCVAAREGEPERQRRQKQLGGLAPLRPAESLTSRLPRHHLHRPVRGAGKPA